MPGCIAIVPAAGVGRRLGGNVPKQYRQIAGKAVLEYSIGALLECKYVTQVIVAISAQDTWWPGLSIAGDERIHSCAGGAERMLSVLAALEFLGDQPSSEDWIMVHDAVRPCLQPADIEMLFDSLCNDQVGGLLAVPARDTLKKAVCGRVTRTIDRDAIWQALTPQMFRHAALRDALRHAIKEQVAVTDEASAMEAVGLMPRLVQGRHDNIKVTWPEDLAIAEGILTRRTDNRSRSTGEQPC